MFLFLRGPKNSTVHPSLAGIRANRDEVLEKGIEVLGNWNQYKAMTEYKKSQ
jgi:hypothetical protein